MLSARSPDSSARVPCDTPSETVTTTAEREPIRLSCQTAKTEEDAMTEWIDGFAEELGIGPLSASETERLLSAARDVAHRVERRITPLSTFLLGMAVAE